MTFTKRGYPSHYPPTKYTRSRKPPSNFTQRETT